MDSSVPIRRKQVLCIDDHVETCDLLGFVFADSGYELVTARSLSEGIGLAQTGRFAVYILDNRLPDGTGVDGCAILKRLHPEIPVVFCSAAAFDHDRREALDAGAEIYLTKPVEMDKLMETVRDLASQCGPA
ncbi:MAG TPA: response regulator [Blastocatellia bacterium]|nr:response regulator [Blastocatellia bacterium]